MCHSPPLRDRRVVDKVMVRQALHEGCHYSRFFLCPHRSGRRARVRRSASARRQAVDARVVAREQHLGDCQTLPVARARVVRIFEQAALEALLGERSAAPTTPGSSRTTASIRTIAASLAAREHVVADGNFAQTGCASMTRWSRPSKRPASRTAPGAAASSRATACVSGSPRGREIDERRAGIGGYGRIDGGPSNVGAQHHAGHRRRRACRPLSCGGRGRSRGCAMVSSAHSPCCRASPASEAASGPGNSSGNSVITVARQGNRCAGSG